MKTGGILRIRSWQSELYVSVSFNDTGGGISQEQMSKLYQPYVTTKASGSGLGLLIVRRIVREHGGEIEIESNEGKGARDHPSSVRRQAHPIVAGSSGRLKSMRGTILIVDDEKPTREGLRQSLEDEFDVYTAGNVDEALNVLGAEHIDLVLTDLRLGGEDGMALIEKILQQPRPPICMLMTAYGSIATAVEAMKRGAYDFVTKPVNIDELGLKIARAIKGRQTEQENVQLRQLVDKRFGLETLIGESRAMHEIFDTIRQVAPSRATVLLVGESGTGKELIAHAIHNLSNRNKTRFVAFNCAAFAPQLIESELFGHERGAFTGAAERRIGRFEQAAGGTFFLDEIGEIDSNVQVKLLRALDPGVFERVGGNQSIQADVRLDRGDQPGSYRARP